MTTVVPSEFGVVLKSLRERARLSQPQLAERAALSKGYIGGMEAGHRGKRPSRDTVQRLADALDVPALELLAAAGRDTPADRGEPTGRLSFESFVAADPLLLPNERQMLVRLYDSYVGSR